VDLWEELLSCVGFALVVPLSAMVIEGMRWSRRAGIERRRQQEAPAGCLACGSLELRWQDPDDVYVCSICGYEGGEGLATRDRRRRDEQLRALPQAEREARAREAVALASQRFELAEQALLAFRARVKGPSTLTVQAELLEGGELVQALGWVHEGLAHLELACVCLDREPPATKLDRLEPEMWLTQLQELDVACVLEDIDLALEAIEVGRSALNLPTTRHPPR
jgi:hypothetical protein